MMEYFHKLDSGGEEILGLRVEQKHSPRGEDLSLENVQERSSDDDQFV